MLFNNFIIVEFLSFRSIFDTVCVSIYLSIHPLSNSGVQVNPVILNEELRKYFEMEGK